eukprot:Ihof_evm3s57 gene=Ihof_evmTU3s57
MEESASQSPDTEAVATSSPLPAIHANPSSEPTTTTSLDLPATQKQDEGEKKLDDLNVINESKSNEVLVKDGKGFAFTIRKILATVPTDPEHFPMPRAHYISVHRPQLVHSIVNHWRENKDSTESQKLERLCRSIASYYHVSFRQSAESLLNLFSYFDPSKGGSRIAKERLLNAEIETREDEFVEQLTAILLKGNYSLMTEAEMEQALRMNYNLNVDIELDTQAVDGRLFWRQFQRIKAKTDDKALNYRADITDYILLFHRGTGIERKTDRFVMEKINLIVAHVQNVVWKAVTSIGKCVGLSGKSRPKEEIAVVDSRIVLPKSTKTLLLVAALVLVYANAAYHQLVHSPEDIVWEDFAKWAVMELLMALAIAYTFLYSPRRKPVMDSEVEKERIYRSKWRGAYPEEVEEASRNIERIRIDQLRLLPVDILDTHTIQEPSFKDIVMVYRPIGSTEIVLKHFHDIPRADLELVFPARIIKLPSMDSVMLLVTVIMGLATIISSSLEAGGFSDKLILSIVGGLGVLGWRAYSQRALALQTQEAALMETLYEKMLSNNDSLILKLVHNCEEQEVSEAVLGYYMLLLHGPLDEQSLDEKAEEFLLTQFHHDIDFKVEHSLHKLLDLQLVVLGETSGKYSCVPVETATQTLAQKWASMDI